MNIWARCPHCRQAAPFAAGGDAQSALDCPSCGQGFVPQAHLFVSDRHEGSKADSSGRAFAVASQPAAVASSGVGSVPINSDARGRWPWRWCALVSVLLLLLAGQIGFFYRSQLLSVRWPETMQPLWEAMCTAVDCLNSASLNLDAISVVSSGFEQQTGGEYLFSLHLQHGQSLALATPAIDLLLTDIGGQPVVRKVLLPEDLGLAPTLLAGDGSQVEVRLRLDPQWQDQVSGFRVELFYP